MYILFVDYVRLIYFVVLTVFHAFEQLILVRVRQTFGVKIVPGRRPPVRVGLQAQFSATRYRGLIAAMEFYAVHAEFLYLRHGLGSRRVFLLGAVTLYETLPKSVLKISNIARRLI